MMIRPMAEIVTNMNNNSEGTEDDTEKIKRRCGEIATQGNHYAMNSDYLKAVNCYTEAINLWPYGGDNDPVDFGFYLNRALCQMKMDFHYLALLDINQAARLRETNPKCYFIRSKILKNLHEFQLAEADLNLALKLCPESEEIRDEMIRFKECNHESFILKEKLTGYDLSDATYYKIRQNYHLVNPRDLPTNLWNYNGIRVENVRQFLDVDIIRSHFGLFGEVKDIKWITHTAARGGTDADGRINQNTDLFIHYYNPVTPIFTIAYFQNKIVPELCQPNHRQQQQQQQNCSYCPLVLYFAPSDEQIGLKFYRPKHPPSAKNTSLECYYWRTTSCHLEENCPRLHLPTNKNIDTQIWMKEKTNVVPSWPSPPVKNRKTNKKHIWNKGGIL